MKTVKSMFNLIEITMAIAVVGIGIAGIMALFPPALEANRTANVNNYVGGIVDSTASYIEYEIGKNWNYITQTSKLPATDFDTAVKGTVGTEYTGFPGLYPISGTEIKMIKSADDSFAGHIQIWKPDSGVENFSIKQVDDAKTTANSQKIYIELSWPAVAPYESREKRIYVYEFYK